MTAVPLQLVLNAAMATLLVVLVSPWAVGQRARRRPGLAHALWLIVLLRLLAPPGVEVPILPAALAGESAPSPSSVVPPETTNTAVPPTSRTSLGPESETAPVVSSWPVLAWASTVAGGDTPALSTPMPRGTAGTPARSSSVAESREHASAASAPRTSTGESLRRAVLHLWWLGSLALAVVLGVRLRAVHRLVEAGSEPGLRLKQRVLTSSRRLGVEPPETVVLAVNMPPALWGLPGRPRLLMPEAVLERLSDDEIDAVVLHELVHLRRRDHWTRWLEVAARVAFWWHPLAWWAPVELRRAEERCCDREVVAELEAEGPDGRRRYAHALLSTLESLTEPSPLAASALGEPASPLEERLKMILSAPPSSPSRSRLRWVGLGLLAAVVAVVPVTGDAPAPSADDTPASESAAESAPSPSWLRPLAPMPPSAPSAAPLPPATLAPPAPPAPAPRPLAAPSPVVIPGAAPPAPVAPPRPFAPLASGVRFVSDFDEEDLEEAELLLEDRRLQLEEQVEEAREEVERRREEIEAEVERAAAEAAQLRDRGRRLEAERLEERIERERARALSELERAAELRERESVRARSELDRRVAELELRRLDAEGRRAEADALREEIVDRAREESARARALEAEELRREVEARRRELERRRAEAASERERRRADLEIEQLEREAEWQERRIELTARSRELEMSQAREVVRLRSALADEQRALHEEMRNEHLRRGVVERLHELRVLLDELGDEGEAATRLEELERAIERLIEGDGA